MRLLDILLAVLVAFIWGSNFVAAKYSIAHISPFFLTTLRFAFTTALLIFFVPRPPREAIVKIIPISALATLHFSLFFVGLYLGLDIATSVLVGQLGVPFSCLFGVMFLKDKIGAMQIAGIAIAFGGIALVVGNPGHFAHPAGFFLTLGSAFFWGLANIQIKRLRTLHHMQLLAWMSFFCTPMLLALAFIFESPSIAMLQAAPLTSWLGLAFTVLASTIVAYGLWYYLLKRYMVSQVSPFSLLTPVFAVAVGQLFFPEPLTLNILLGGAITIFGVAIIVMRQPKLAELAEAT